MSAAPPQAQARTEGLRARAPPLLVESITSTGPAIAAFDEPFNFRFTAEVSKPLPEPFDVVVKWANIMDQSQDMTLDEMEIGPVDVTAPGQQAAFELEADPLALADLTFDETDLLSNHVVEVQCLYKGQLFAAQTFEVEVTWKDAKHEEELPEAITSDLLRREIMKNSSKKRVMHSVIDWGLGEDGTSDEQRVVAVRAPAGDHAVAAAGGASPEEAGQKRPRPE